MRNRPWTDAEIGNAIARRGQLTAREIGAIYDPPRSAKAVELLFARLDAKNPGGRPQLRNSVQTTKPTVPDGIARRLGVECEGTASGPTSITARSLRRSALHENNNLEPILIVSDAHRPYHSRVWWDLLMQVGRTLRPKHLIVIGDFADFYGVSDHDKDPERANRLDEELADAEQGLDELDALGAEYKLYVGGNHEDRMRRYLMKNPALARVVSVEKLLRLKERGWQYVPYKHHESLGAVHFTHDVGAAGRNAVFRALDVYGHSVVSGHTHRLAYIVEGTATGECKLSATFGWGGDTEAIDYMNLARARKDWALGFGIGYLEPSSGFVYLVPVPVVHGTCVVNGQLFRSVVAA